MIIADSSLRSETVRKLGTKMTGNVNTINYWDEIFEATNTERGYKKAEKCRRSGIA